MMSISPSPRAALLSGVILLGGLALGCSRPAAKPEETPPAPVQVVRPWKETLDEWTELPGTTQPLPNHVARVTASLEGRVLSVLPAGPSGKAVTEGQHVEAGQVIVQLDDRIARDNLAKAEASLNEAAALRKQAATAIQLARIDVQRLEGLQGGSSGSSSLMVSPVDIEKARVALRNAEAQQQAAVAHEASSTADVQVLKRQLSFYSLRAPITGWLGTIQVVPGQTIAVGTPVAEVLDLRELDLLCLVPPSRVGRLALKQPARIVGTDANAQEQSSGAEGQVVYIAVQADPDTGSFPVKVRFSNPDLRLRANTVVRVRIRTAPPAERLVLPMEALLSDQDPPQVVVVNEIKEEEGEKVGTVRLLQAVLGVRNRQRGLVEILGLEDPEHKDPVPPVAAASFVVAGGHGLEDKDKVKIEEAPRKEEK